MHKINLLSIGIGTLSNIAIAAPAIANSDLFLAYPPLEHQTTSDRIFLIGTADPAQSVLVNGEIIDNRSESGHFAPTVPLEMGVNTLTLSQGEDTIEVTVTRLPATPVVSPELGYLVDSLAPQVSIARPAGELICFSAIARPNASISVDWAGKDIILTPASQMVALPPNSAVLVSDNEPLPQAATTYEGCAPMPATGSPGQPTYTVTIDGQVNTHTLPAPVSRLPRVPFQIAEVVAESGVARTGPSTNYSRITPLPQGTRAAVTGIEGDWLRLDYGGWIRASETVIATASAPSQATIRSVTSRQVPGWTEVRFPLNATVPITIDQTADTLTLTLHNTTPQTDTIYLDEDPVIERLDWSPVLPDKAQYRFQFKTAQQWGYKTHYEGTTLVLSLRHPPQLAPGSLSGSRILIDPGHGSENDLGARGPNGYPEKDVNLVVSKLLRDALEARGATVIMTREGDDDLFPGDRVEIINDVEPTLALSIHYNALPDAGDALNTAGIGMFWYNAQAYSLSQFLHDYLVRELDRPSYGVYWNNLALTRPTVAPAVLLELGFMINPYEFEWITDPDAQVELADALADAVEIWMQGTTQ
ncbi:N-acetylmuramoyl-L-alanine amidase [Oscillatoria sp. CS-180]|uniref:N-acetylmuramoyl-L-alanine amidase n=1 Tax=Oscillatoria sp. CS-180 TaxID=3021720 RepID=UPI00232FC3D7|nr:N-acetylmuramoyl-L-alanine amidase [Oscillatoria sp. CS-180]MDB9529881.1 N-acetylmuramoyl-L-alanine amidase [Oscillatoria sp. CS-180]